MLILAGKTFSSHNGRKIPSELCDLKTHDTGNRRYARQSKIIFPRLATC